MLGNGRPSSRRDATWTAGFRHRAYGVALDSAGSVPFELRYRWIGRELDEETGLYYLRARYYDPNSQRFTQEDPIGFGGGSNVYAYGNGNPTNGRDLNGLAKDYEYTALGAVDPYNALAGCMGAWECGSSTAGAGDLGWGLAVAQEIAFRAWLTTNVHADASFKYQLRREYESSPAFRATMAALLSDGKNYYVLVGDYLASKGQCASVGEQYCRGGLPSGVPSALAPRGQGLGGPEISAGMERFLGGNVTGGVVWIPENSVPSRYVNMGQLVWHEVTHFIAWRDPYYVRSNSHLHPAFCGVPGPQPPSSMCRGR